MRRFHSSIALFVCLAWWVSLVHVAAEGNNRMQACGSSVVHCHGMTEHAHGGAGHDTHESENTDSHGPLVAQNNLKEKRGQSGLLLLAVVAVVVLPRMRFIVRPQSLAIPAAPEWREQHVLNCWRFVWRCASFTTAPPCLG